MELPSVVHPRTFRINGHLVQVVAYCTLTEPQAMKAAVIAARSLKLPKKAHPSMVYRALTLYTEETRSLLGP